MRWLDVPRRQRVVGVLLGVGLMVGAAGYVRAQAPASQTAGGNTTTTWYYYKVKWGHQDEFVDLFQKNHYPLLKAEVASGRFASVKTYVPRYHGDGRADWTFAVEIVANDKFTGARPKTSSSRSSTRTRRPIGRKNSADSRFSTPTGTYR